MKEEQDELKTKGKLIMDSSLSAFTLAAIIGASAAAPLISGTVKLNPRVEFIRFYWGRGRRKSKFTEGGLEAEERRRKEEKGRRGRGGWEKNATYVARVYQV